MIYRKGFEVPPRDKPDPRPLPQPYPGKLQLLLKSRKFWAALVGLVLVVVKVFFPDLQLDETAVTNIVLVLIAYIVGTAMEDGFRAGISGK